MANVSNLKKAQNVTAELVKKLDNEEVFTGKWWQDWCGRLQDKQVSAADVLTAGKLKSAIFEKIKSDPVNGQALRNISDSYYAAADKHNDLELSGRDPNGPEVQNSLAKLGSVERRWLDSGKLTPELKQQLEATLDLIKAIKQQRNAQAGWQNVGESISDALHYTVKPKL